MSVSAPTAMRSSANVAKRLGLLAAQFLLTPGPKMIWQFGELGANQSTKNSSGNNTDPKRVIWNNLENVNYGALYDIYRALLSLRKDNPELFAADATYIQSNLGTNVTSPRTIVLRSGTKEVVAFINPTSSGSAMTVTARASYLSSSNNQLICASPGVNAKLSGSSNVSVSLPMNTMAVFATNSVAGVEDIIGDADAATSDVYGGNGEIIIAGDYISAQAYTLDGRAVSLTGLPAGIYVVNVDGVAHKVAVR